MDMGTDLPGEGDEPNDLLDLLYTTLLAWISELYVFHQLFQRFPWRGIQTLDHSLREQCLLDMKTEWSIIQAIV